jgi:hypothetical protein
MRVTRRAYHRARTVCSLLGGLGRRRRSAELILDLDVRIHPLLSLLNTLCVEGSANESEHDTAMLGAARAASLYTHDFEGDTKKKDPRDGMYAPFNESGHLHEPNHKPVLLSLALFNLALLRVDGCDDRP